MPASFNGFGTTFLGERDFQPDGSYLTTEWFIFAFLPTVPLKSHRVIRMPVRDINAVVYSSQGYVIVETLPNNGTQVLHIYAFTFLYAIWACLAIGYLVSLSSRWPDHELHLAFIGIALCAAPAIIPLYLRWRARRSVAFSQAAFAETIRRLAAEGKVSQQTKTPPPT